MQHEQSENPVLGEGPRTSVRIGTSIRRGTGPRTLGGKEKSKCNATKHGIFSSVAVIEGESREEYETFLNGFCSYFQPEGTPEIMLVEQLATSYWRLRRLIKTEGSELTQKHDLFDATLFRSRSSDSLGLDNLIRYEVTLERGIDRALSQLERLQRMRRGLPVTPQLNLNISRS